MSATIAEGSFNKTFRLAMDNESAAIAKIPHPIDGPKYYTTAPEVATMDFAGTILQIPLPQVYAWNLYIDSAEYIHHHGGSSWDKARGCHTDLHSGNLFVDNGHITSAIDWQGAWAGPLFLERRHPRPIDHHGDVF
ncbi:predicted protein [Histoplasma mississippiense (nom. inval.)]|uniref:predicted protein n=1 Tax=Ajellomyces capsulatus (strain NAm1 / WU24) TaxID=2059318 RepID=UPI000157C38E|nr:predicted protein [Histoplasma mississippiense (nom. inval.)]EDN07706.1 predicted protein [Histoplasma mississippiense (nom. inval.)]